MAPMQKKYKKTKEDILIKKIKKLYANYGINTDDMDEEELFRICDQYISKNKNIDEDIQKSETYKDKFSDDEIIG
jgi:hypothetical protein